MKENTQSLYGPRVYKLSLVYLTNLFCWVNYEASNGKMTVYDKYNRMLTKTIVPYFVFLLKQSPCNTEENHENSKSECPIKQATHVQSKRKVHSPMS